MLRIFVFRHKRPLGGPAGASVEQDLESLRKWNKRMEMELKKPNSVTHDARRWVEKRIQHNQRLLLDEQADVQYQKLAKRRTFRDFFKKGAGNGTLSV